MRYDNISVGVTGKLYLFPEMKADCSRTFFDELTYEVDSPQTVLTTVEILDFKFTYTN